MSGKLLLISDLEGCQNDQFGAIQSQVTCSEEFFAAIEKHLEDKTNKVAFLGDYFDQGDKVVFTINRIIGLYEKYEGRVIVILGNRDINKLRLCYELGDVNSKYVQGTGWGLWKDFFNTGGLGAMEIVDKMGKILKQTMGAKGGPIHPNLTFEESVFVLAKVFDPTRAGTMKVNEANINTIIGEFVTNCRKLFVVGKIVHKEGNTLLSHGGGVDPFIFHKQKYYDRIVQGISPDASYYAKMELCRKALETKPPIGDELVADSESFNDNIYNGPLRSFLTDINFNTSNYTSPTNPSGNFFLLQALGQKPDNGGDDVIFTSFIQSNDQLAGCKGPKLYNSTLYAKYLADLHRFDVKIIASGHVPHCAPIPLIYTRNDTGIIFSLNDTSNGYRPQEITKINQVPLCFITNNTIGIGSLPDLESETTLKTYNNVDYSSMVKTWVIDDTGAIPTFNTVTKDIDYKDGSKLVFPSRASGKMFLPAIMDTSKRIVSSGEKQLLALAESNKKRFAENPLTSNQKIRKSVMSRIAAASGKSGTSIGGSRRRKTKLTKHRKIKHLKTKRANHRNSRRKIR